MNSSTAATTRFRRIVLIFSIIAAGITILILVADPRECTTSNLKLGLWLAFSIHISASLAVLLHLLDVFFHGCLELLFFSLGLPAYVCTPKSDSISYQHVEHYNVC